MRTTFARELTLVGGGLTDIATPLNITSAFQEGSARYSALGFTVQNQDPAIAFGDFALLGKSHKDAPWVTILSNTGWDSLAGRLLNTTGTIKSLGAGLSGQALVDLRGLIDVKFQAKSAGANVISNGTFTGNATDWTLGAGIAYASNAVSFTAATATAKQALADMDTGWTDGKTYAVTFDITGYSAGFLTVGTNTDDSQGDPIEANGSYEVFVTADDHADGLVFTATGFTGVIDNVVAVPVLDKVQIWGTLQ